MIKKIINNLLVILLCISLVGCSNKSINNSNSQQDIEPGTVVVHIVINPEFKIHIGNDGNVFYVECLNKDAKSINDKVNVIGEPCKDAIILILNETVQQKLLKDGGRIEVNVFVAEDIANQLDTWNNMVMNGVMQVLTDHKLNADISFGSDMMGNHENSNTNNDNQQGNTDNNPSKDNNTTKTDEYGNTNVKGEDGSITVIDKNGKMIKVIFVDYNGENVTQNFDENENFAYEERAPLGKAELFAGETIIHTNDSGDKTTITFGQNGQLQLHRQEFSDGSITEHSYYEDGSLQREYDLRVDSTYVDISYDINGNRAKENAKYDDGSEWELTYNPDGSYYGYTYYPDGSIWYNEWDANHVQDLGAQKKIK